MLEVLGDRRMAIVRELTKLHEEVFRGTIREAVEHFQEPRGEFTIVIDGCEKEVKPTLTAEIEDEIRSLQSQGIPAKDGVARLADATGLSRKELYRVWLALKDGAGS
jgi:16S rRNA (cytidine1402-2'-O)-methyltransferase